MMGSKKLSAIKRELRQALGNDKELAAWLDRQCSRPSPKEGDDSTVEKDLLWVRDLLRQGATGKKPRRRKLKNATPTKKSATR